MWVGFLLIVLIVLIKSYYGAGRVKAAEQSCVYEFPLTSSRANCHLRHYPTQTQPNRLEVFVYITFSWYGTWQTRRAERSRI